MAKLVKAQYKEKLCCFNFSTVTIESLYARLVQAFYLENGVKLHITYCDDDNDWVTISTQEELDDASHLSEVLLLRVHPSETGYVPPGIVENATIITTTDSNDNNNVNAEHTSDVKVDLEKAARNGDSNGGKTSESTGVSDFDVFANEFHYHRLIVQTAVQEAFREFRRGASKHFSRARMENMMEDGERQRVLIRDAFNETLAELRSGIENLPSPLEVADNVVRRLDELRVYSAPILNNIKIRIISLLDSLFEKKEAITACDIEQSILETQSFVEEEAGQPSSSHGASNNNDGNNKNNNFNKEIIEEADGKYISSNNPLLSIASTDSEQQQQEQPYVQQQEQEEVQQQQEEEPQVQQQEEKQQQLEKEEFSETQVDFGEMEVEEDFVYVEQPMEQDADATTGTAALEGSSYEPTFVTESMLVIPVLTDSVELYKNRRDTNANNESDGTSNHDTVPLNDFPYNTELEQLVSMGFNNEAELKQLLVANEGNVDMVLENLLSM